MPGNIELKSRDGSSYDAQLADTVLRKMWGLSLKKQGKMLFVFSREKKPGIDMMLLSKPLNLYFLNSEKKVVDVQTAEPWTFDPRTWKIYRPEKPSKYLLESFEDLKLEEGEKVEFDL